MKIDIEKIIRELLPEVIHMSLGTSHDNKPWVCEVHYAYDENLNLYFRSLTTRRHCQEIADNPNVAGNIVKQVQIGQPCTGVVNFEGTARLLESEQEQDAAFACIKKRFNIDQSTREEAKRQDGHQFYKIAVNNWSIFGRFDGESNKKYELKWGTATL